MFHKLEKTTQELSHFSYKQKDGRKDIKYLLAALLNTSDGGLIEVQF